MYVHTLSKHILFSQRNYLTTYTQHWELGLSVFMQSHIANTLIVCYCYEERNPSGALWLPVRVW